MSWSSASTSEQVRPVDAEAVLPDGSTLGIVVAGGPLVRARGVRAVPDVLDGDLSEPTALWLGRTPQVHTLGMTRPVAVATGVVSARDGHGRPTALRIGGVRQLKPGRLGPWHWSWPVTVELHPEVARRSGLVGGSEVSLTWPSSSAPGPDGPRRHGG